MNSSASKRRVSLGLPGPACSDARAVWLDVDGRWRAPPLLAGMGGEIVRLHPGHLESEDLVAAMAADDASPLGVLPVRDLGHGDVIAEGARRLY